MGRFSGLGPRAGVRFLTVAGALLIGNACSPSSNGTSDPGAAGTTGRGGSSGSSVASAGSAGSFGGVIGGGGAGTAGASADDNPTDACIAYVLAVCGRRAECSLGDSTACIQQSFDCPDMFFSVGTTRTVAGTRACIETYKTFPCAELLAGDLPACVSAGTRAAGQACSFPSQCSSLNCTLTRPSTTCGVCATAGPLGADCSAPVVCNDGLRCNTANVCETVPPSTAHSAKEGEPCTVSDGCVDSSLYCSSSQICTKLPTLGTSCQGAGACAAGSYCDGTTCAAYPPLGAACAQLNAFGDGICDPNALCSSGVCIAKGAPGATCTTSTECADGLLCECTDAQTCSARVCTQ